MLENILFGYLVVAVVVLCFCLTIFWHDQTTPKNDLTSWAIILIAPLFYPITIPLSIIELSNFQTKKY